MKNYTISIFIDFKKAFDMVNEMLLYNLEYYAIRRLVNWLMISSNLI